MNIGKGKIVSKEKGKGYQGTMPFSSGDKVVVIRESDLEEIINHKIELLLKTGRKMPEELYLTTPIKDENGKEIFELPPPLTDEISYLAPDKTSHRLFLDRKIYGPNLKDMLLIRYVSIDEAVMEEDLFGVNEE